MEIVKSVDRRYNEVETQSEKVFSMECSYYLHAKGELDFNGKLDDVGSDIADIDLCRLVHASYAPALGGYIEFMIETSKGYTKRLEPYEFAYLVGLGRVDGVKVNEKYIKREYWHLRYTGGIKKVTDTISLSKTTVDIKDIVNIDASGVTVEIQHKKLRLSTKCGAYIAGYYYNTGNVDIDMLRKLDIMIDDIKEVLNSNNRIVILPIERNIREPRYELYRIEEGKIHKYTTINYCTACFLDGMGLLSNKKPKELIYTKLIRYWGYFTEVVGSVRKCDSYNCLMSIKNSDIECKVPLEYLIYYFCRFWGPEWRGISVHSRISRDGDAFITAYKIDQMNCSLEKEHREIRVVAVDEQRFKEIKKETEEDTTSKDMRHGDEYLVIVDSENNVIAHDKSTILGFIASGTVENVTIKENPTFDSSEYHYGGIDITLSDGEVVRLD